jgi:hypothetical protein
MTVCVFDGRYGWKYNNQIKITALKKEKETPAHQKRARSLLNKERMLDLRQ